jgi:hypothetical protein
MQNRFEDKDIQKLKISDRTYRIISVAIFVAILVLFFLAVDSMGRSSISKEQQSLENALSRDIVQCYAIEGRYPPSLEYLEQHYGLTYDKSTFFVDYLPIAGNLYPDVTVILLQN